MVHFTVKYCKATKMNSLHPPATTLWMKPQTKEHILNDFFLLWSSNIDNKWYSFRNAFLNRKIINRTKSESLITLVSGRWITFMRLEMWMEGTHDGFWSASSVVLLDIGACYTGCLNNNSFNFIVLHAVLYVCCLSDKDFKVMWIYHPEK